MGAGPSRCVGRRHQLPPTGGGNSGLPRVRDRSDSGVLGEDGDFNDHLERQLCEEDCELQLDLRLLSWRVRDRGKHHLSLQHRLDFVGLGHRFFDHRHQRRPVCHSRKSSSHHGDCASLSCGRETIFNFHSAVPHQFQFEDFSHFRPDKIPNKSPQRSGDRCPTFSSPHLHHAFITSHSPFSHANLITANFASFNR
jgi:hypothetical protein